METKQYSAATAARIQDKYLTALCQTRAWSENEWNGMMTCGGIGRLAELLNSDSGQRTGDDSTITKNQNGKEEKKIEKQTLNGETVVHQDVWQLSDVVACIVESRAGSSYEMSFPWRA